MAGGGLSLGARFNLILIAVFVMGAAVSWSALNVIMLKYAERQAATNADGIRTAMSSVRDYTREDVSRWLQQLQTEKDIFIPEPSRPTRHSAWRRTCGLSRLQKLRLPRGRPQPDQRAGQGRRL